MKSPRKSSARQSKLKWTRELDNNGGDGFPSISHWASHGDMSFSIVIVCTDAPKETYHLDMCVWDDDGDKPVFETSLNLKQSLDKIEQALPTFKIAVLTGAALELERRAKLIRGFVRSA